MGYCTNQAGQDATATNSYEEALRAGLQTPEVLNNLGYGYAVMNRLPEAERKFSEAIRLNPNLQAPYYNRGRLALHRLQTQIRNDVRFFQQDFSQIAKTLVLTVPRTDNGAADFERALDLGPRSAQLHREAANLYALMASQKSRQLKLVMSRVERLSNRGRPSKTCSLFAALLKPVCDDLLSMADDHQAKERALHHLREACRLGLDPAALKSDPDFRLLRNDRAFLAILESRSSMQPVYVLTRILDPLTGQ